MLHRFLVETGSLRGENLVPLIDLMAALKP